MADPTETPDYGAPDFEWPEVNTLRPVDALRLLDSIEREATAANKRAETLKKHKATAKVVMTQVLDMYEQETVRAKNDLGNVVNYTPYDFDVFNIDNEDEFLEWAAEEDEEYYDREPKLRKQVFLDRMRQLHKDGEPLPPGVSHYTEKRISRTALGAKPVDG